MTISNNLARLGGYDGDYQSHRKERSNISGWYEGSDLNNTTLVFIRTSTFFKPEMFLWILKMSLNDLILKIGFKAHLFLLFWIIAEIVHFFSKYCQNCFFLPHFVKFFTIFSHLSMLSEQIRKVFIFGDF